MSARLQFLVETMGAERVMLGSDYPFPLGEHRVGSLIRSSHLAPKAKERLLGANAVDFLGLNKLGLSKLDLSRLSLSKDAVTTTEQPVCRYRLQSCRKRSN